MKTKAKAKPPKGRKPSVPERALPAISPPVSLPVAVERALVQGDLSALSAEERIAYYRAVCKSLSLNPLTRPFDYLTLNSRLVLYARRDCTDQLRQTRNVRIEILERSEVNGLCVVRARASLPTGRSDEALGAVPVKGLGGVELANALMKAETKAKRRVTLSICGLGILDESEVEDGSFAPAEAPKPEPEIMPRRLPSATPAPEPPPATLPAAPQPVPDGAPMRAEPAPAGSTTPEPTPSPAHLQPGQVAFELNGQQVVTNGITKPTLLKVYKMSTQLDQLTKVGAAKDLLGRDYGVEHRTELTEEQGGKLVAELVKRVNQALEARARRPQG